MYDLFHDNFIKIIYRYFDHLNKMKTEKNNYSYDLNSKNEENIEDDENEKIL